MFEKNLNIGYLLDFYGDVLTERRRDALDFYYNNDMSLSEIAVQCGYADYAFFSKKFKSVVGLSPREYKNTLPK